MTYGYYDIEALANKNKFIITQDETGDWDQNVNAWGNHPTIDPVAFHYCCAITKENLLKVNGFDERLAFGVSFEDDWFVRQVQNAGLTVEITEYPFVVHQWHERLSHNIMQNAPQMWDKNYRVLFNELIPLNEYRAKHILTRDLHVES
jgi:GT2 family glycosyltransferase